MEPDFQWGWRLYQIAIVLAIGFGNIYFEIMDNNYAVAIFALAVVLFMTWLAGATIDLFRHGIRSLKRKRAKSTGAR